MLCLSCGFASLALCLLWEDENKYSSPQPSQQPQVFIISQFRIGKKRTDLNQLVEINRRGALPGRSVSPSSPATVHRVLTPARLHTGFLNASPCHHLRANRVSQHGPASRETLHPKELTKAGCQAGHQRSRHRTPQGLPSYSWSPSNSSTLQDNSLQPSF